jgi:hypothetical protein
VHGTVTTILVEYRDRFCRFGAEYAEAALDAQGSRLVIVDPSEVDDILVLDVTQVAHLALRLPPRQTLGCQPSQACGRGGLRGGDCMIVQMPTKVQAARVAELTGGTSLHLSAL